MSEFEANVLHRKALSVKARGPVSWTCGKGADQWLEMRREEQTRARSFMVLEANQGSCY